ncbi:MAG: zinc-dependent metalloprotease [Saprospiraceae bacterium]|nr:zinc-dependent metalloprotease [Saprospiraceae bacterium]
MRHSLLFFLLLALTPKISAQEPLKTQLAPCGTLGISDWLKESRFRQPVQDRSGDTMWVAIKTHLLAKDNGIGRISIEKYLDSFCQLNEDFSDTDIQFFMKDGWNLLNESDWHVHNTIPEGIDMMLTNNVPDALNAYFVADPAGNCGYNLPYAGVAIAHGCSGDNDHTWAHEVGHALNLPHPFIGWEGKLYNFNTPTPTVLTYDYTYFHDTLDTQVPAPLDTALVELVDGSNCAIAADRICDTPPDYLSYRWECDAENKSLLKQKDPTGAEFYSDGTLFMSYALDQCQNRFSPEEINIMRATLLTERLNWVAPGITQEPVTDNPVAIEPVQDQIVPVNGAVLRWNAVPNATHYLVQASRFASFSFKQLDIVTTDTFAIAGQLAPNLKYYWRIRPFNNRHTCAPFSALSSFKTSQVSPTTEPDAEGWRCYPSILAPDQPLTIQIPEDWKGHEIRCQIYDAAGRLVWQQKQEWSDQTNSLQLPSGQWSAGVYLLTCTGKTGSKTERLTVDGGR